MSDEVEQKAEWRTRLITALAERVFDTETLVAMLEAALEQAHSEGLRDAAAVCQSVADAVESPLKKHVASVLAKSIRELDALNRATKPPAA